MNGILDEPHHLFISSLCILTRSTHLSYCNGIWVQLMKHMVSKHQVYQCLSIYIQTKIFIIITAEALANST